MSLNKLILTLCALPALVILPGCCVFTCPNNAGAEAAQTLCGDCGEVKGTDTCCDANAERCDCGKIKGSPGCCK
ncbi:MAG: hypothetical protein QF724_01475 [Planctomycetota bacterium]|jgi:hypothetical protein|nr:hypothetical protein [Planctomycetota bacterium]MDP6837583.1 hypothetical protein [Planctomycetota bacterium]MDP6954678.1 hypothetical protein [Planctomycetota bacterium]